MVYGKGTHVDDTGCPCREAPLDKLVILAQVSGVEGAPELIVD